MHVEYYVFSGTGNTMMIANRMAKRIRTKGHSVSIHTIYNSTKCDTAPDSILGIAFPVAFFSTYPVVLDFIDSLPEGNGRKVFMMATMAGSGMGIERNFKKLFEKKGYVPVGSELFLMPSNYNNVTIPVEKNKKIVANALVQADAFADKLTESSAEWNKGIPIVSSMWSWFMRSGKATKLFYRMFPIRVDKTKCIKCMRCLENCPVSAISIENDFPLINKKLCQSCQRCVAFCPVQAIGVENKSTEQYRAAEYQ